MLTIGYAGSLAGYDPKNTSHGYSRKSLVSIYRNKFHYSATRSGYFFFRGLEILKKEYGLSEKDIQVHFWGRIDPVNLQQVRQFDIADLVKIEGYKTKKETQNLLTSFDLLFLPLELNNEDHNTLFIPGKVFEYLSMRKPILLLSDESDCKKVVEKANLGFFAKPTDPNEIASLLKQLIDNKQLLMELIPNESYIKSCSFEETTKKIASVFDTVSNNN